MKGIREKPNMTLNRASISGMRMGIWDEADQGLKGQVVHSRPDTEVKKRLLFFLQSIEMASVCYSMAWQCRWDSTFLILLSGLERGLYLRSNKKRSFSKMLITMISSNDFKTRRVKVKLQIEMCLARDCLKKLKVPLAWKYLRRSKLQMRHAPQIRKSKDSERHDMKLTHTTV